MLRADAHTEVFRPCLRAAWFVFAMQHLLILMPIIRASPAAPWMSGGLPATFAILLVLAGARKRSGAILVGAAAVFVAAIVLKIVVTESSQRVAGRHSVVSLETGVR